MDLNGSEFFFGRQYDLVAKQALTDKLVLYDPTDLTTHAVITGMTGSGKTGMGIILLEEAALQGIPAILIDPKGDLTNHLLHFPDLLPSDFAPWIDTDTMRNPVRLNMSMIVPGLLEAYFQLSGLMMTSERCTFAGFGYIMFSTMFCSSGSQPENSFMWASAVTWRRGVRTAGSK